MTMIFFSEIPRQRTIVFIVPRREIAVFRQRELVSGNRIEKVLWRKAKQTLFPHANLASVELAADQSPDPGTGWVTEIFAIDESQVTTYGDNVIAKHTARINAYERAGITLFDNALGFALTGAQLFPHSSATAIGIQGVVVPQGDGANCFIGPEAIIAPGWPHHAFDGTQAGFEATWWRTVFPTVDPPRWPT
jgi:hypothetical protein